MIYSNTSVSTEHSFPSSKQVLKEDLFLQKIRKKNLYIVDMYIDMIQCEYNHTNIVVI